MTVAIGEPTPMALVRQIIRRGVRNLTVVDRGFSLDMLIAAGCVRKIVSYYAGGGSGRSRDAVVSARGRARRDRGLGMRRGNPVRRAAGGGADRCRSCRGAADSALRCRR